MDEQRLKVDIDVFKERHLFIATPCYGGMLTDGYFKSMLRVTILWSRLGLKYTLSTIANESLIPRGRNGLVAQFMNDDRYTDMIFIDADISFEAEDLLRLWARLAQQHRDVVVGAYPKKCINWRSIHKAVTEKDADSSELSKYQSDYVVNFRSDEHGNIPCRSGLIPVLDAGTGFMIFQKSVIEKMIDKWPELWYRQDMGPQASGMNKWFYAFFDTMIDPDSKRYLSEDYTFCRRWQQLGGTVWLDPSINLNHQGSFMFRGNISNILHFTQDKKDEKDENSLWV